MRGRLLLLPPLLLLCIALPHLGDGEFRRDTVRYAAVGQHLFENGDPLAPELRPGVPYFNKPPVALWIHGASMKLLGGGLAAARLPSVLASVGVVLLSMLCARRIGGRNEAIASGFLLVISYEFIRRTREISLDLWMLFFIMAATWLVILELRERTRWRPIAAGAFLGLALLTKPLIALGVPLLLWLCFFRGSRMRGCLRLMPALYGGALVVALPWHLYMWQRFGGAFLEQYFGHQVVARARGELGSEGPLYYLTLSEWSLLPWLVALLGAWVWFVRSPRRQREPGLLAAGWIWTLCWLVALSAFADKKPNYLLPVWPALSWAAAFGLCRLRVPLLTRWHRSSYAWLAPAAVVVSIGVALLPIQLQKGKGPDLDAFLREMEEREIPIGNLAAERLLDNDYCYLYLKTGSWPLRDRTGATHLLTRAAQVKDAELVIKVGARGLWKLPEVKSSRTPGSEASPPAKGSG